MKKILLLLIASNLSLLSFTQITKNNWLVGGNGSFSSTKSESSSISNSSRTYWRIEPHSGYFFVDKFAAGVSVLFNHENTSIGTVSSKQTYYSVGPFARYYFLPADRQVNIFSEGSYQHLVLNPGKYGSNSYNLLLGSAVFFNNCVGLEFTTGYSITNNSKSDLKYKIIQVGIGLQIHLEKD